MHKWRLILFMNGLLLVISLPAWSHFGMLIPSDTMVMQDDRHAVTLMLAFAHPFEMVGMELAKPKVFNVFKDGNHQSLLKALQTAKNMGHTAWQTRYPIKRPGVYTFYMEPEPYWEPAEETLIIHYTKTVIAAFGDDEGWDAELGLKTEIVPLARPFGLYAGNLFQGVVKLDGKPVPFAEVEVEYYKRQKQLTAPTEYMITQSLKADRNGLFTYAAPIAGWWGFAALTTADHQLVHEGIKRDVELGAVIWVYFDNIQH